MVPLTAGTSQLQKEKTIIALVIEMARKLARDLYRASSRPRMGMCRGSGGV